jgi:enterobactin synthetase component D
VAVLLRCALPDNVAALPHTADVIIETPRLASMATDRRVPDSALRQCSVQVDDAGELARLPGITAVALPPDVLAAVPKRQWQYRAGRLCAMQALAALGYPNPGMVIARSQSGVPLWPAGTIGSITHTDDYVSAAVARADRIRAIGIDTEGIVSDARLRTIQGTVAWASEIAAARSAGCDRQTAATLVFSAKESIFKCLHAEVGRIFDFRDVRLVAVDLTKRRFTARVARTLSPAWRASTLIEGCVDVDERWVHTGMFLVAEAAGLSRTATPATAADAVSQCPARSASR